MPRRTSPPPLPPRTLQQEDLRLLACPVCRGPLALDTGCVRCSGCGRRYPIADGIPVLLAGRAS